MNTKHLKGWLKHLDFIVIDIVVLQVSALIVYLVLDHSIDLAQYRGQALTFLLAQLIAILFSSNYQGILRRRKWDELMAVVKMAIYIVLVSLFFLFVIHSTGFYSRIRFSSIIIVYIIIDFLLRQVNKQFILKRHVANQKSMVLITSSDLVDKTMEDLTKKNIYQDFFISAIILLDNKESLTTNYEIPVFDHGEEALDYLSHNWVDEVFILHPENMLFPTELFGDLVKMGITVNYSLSAIIDDNFGITDIRKLGKYKVLTNSIKFITPGEAFMKRALDIVGGIVGCIVTGILYIFIAPAIYKKSPGPIFFAQERVGLNGKTFKMYKFRSMYLDAEERKAELQDQNKVESGMMFKMDDDPRIIGSEKKDKDGNPKGIGNFIRNTSLDEFPQFFNVLKGDMSVVGWRPCTLDEWDKYTVVHRIRAAMKPGITGMWQVSGRSEITDFDEIVRLDREYIDNWSLALDIKLIIKTVLVVIKRKGAK